MNIHLLIILVIIAISAAVFGGVIFFGLQSSVAPVAPFPVISDGATSRIPDIPNLLESGNNQTKPQGREDARGGIRETTSENIVVEIIPLPAPLIPIDRVELKQFKQSSAIKPQLPAGNLPFSPVLPLNSSGSSRATTSSLLPFVPQQPTEEQSAAIAQFSVFNVSPELRDFRAQMVQAGVIKETEFIKINNNSDMEQFLLRLVAWHGQKASSTPAQMQDARDRIIRAYDKVSR